MTATVPFRTLGARWRCKTKKPLLNLDSFFSTNYWRHLDLTTNTTSTTGTSFWYDEILDVHSTTHVQLRYQGSGSSRQLSSALHSQALNKTQVLCSSALYSQGGPTIVGLFKPQLSHYKCGTFAAMLTWRSCMEITLRHTVQRNWFMPLPGHQQIPMAQILYHPSVYLAFSISLTRITNFLTEVHKSQSRQISWPSSCLLQELLKIS